MRTAMTLGAGLLYLALTQGAAFAESNEYKVGDLMPDIYTSTDMLYELNNWGDGQCKGAKLVFGSEGATEYAAFFPRNGWSKGDLPFAVIDIETRQLVFDNLNNKEGLGPDGIIDHVFDKDHSDYSTAGLIKYAPNCQK